MVKLALLTLGGLALNVSMAYNKPGFALAGGILFAMAIIYG
jgi:hypothetical protein